MAGETPGATDAQKARAAQRRADNAFANNRNADKSYKSGDKSAIDSTRGGMDAAGRPGTVPTPIPTPRSREGDHSTDRYYREGGSKGSAPPAARYGEMGAHLVRRAPIRTQGEGSGRRLPDGPVPMSGSEVARVSAGSLFIGMPEHIQPVVHNAVEVLERSGSEDSIVTIEIPAGMKQLMRRARAMLDLMTTRTEVSEAHTARIKLAYSLSASGPSTQTKAPAPAAVRPKPLSQSTLDELLGPPVPKEAPPVSVDEQDSFDALLDPAAVLRGETSVEEPVDTSPLAAPNAVETTETAETDEDDGMPNLDPAIAAEPAAPTPEGVINPIEDVLAATAPEVPEAPPAPVAAPEVPQDAGAPKRRAGKRSGRGS